MIFSGSTAHAFLGFDGLVQPFGPAPAGHQSSGELVDDKHFARLHQIILVALEEELGAQGLVQVAEQRALLGSHVFRAVGVAQGDIEDLFHVRFADLGQGDGAVLSH